MRMASALKGVSVLIVEDDADTLDMLFLGLGAVGARVQTAASAEAALALLQRWRPDVVLSDIQLPGADGYELLALLRANPRLRRIPAAALSGVGAMGSAARRAEFEKYLTKPTKLPEIVTTVASLVGHERPAAPVDRPIGHLRDALARFTAASGCRYTSLLRFAPDDTLSDIWTYDRDSPKADPFPIGLPVHVSDCLLTRDAKAGPKLDPRVATDPRRTELARYLGVPLFRDDGTLLGTLCCYDQEPRAIDQHARSAVAAAARNIEPLLSAVLAET